LAPAKRARSSACGHPPWGVRETPYRHGIEMFRTGGLRLRAECVPGIRGDFCESPPMAEVETSRDGGVLTITLNRPDVLNAFTAAMHEALAAALKDARAADVRAVVITGAGRGFCVGQVLTEFRE